MLKCTTRTGTPTQIVVKASPPDSTPQPDLYAKSYGSIFQNFNCGNVSTNDKRHLSLVTRKPVFGVFDQVRLKSASAAAETS